MTNQGGTYSQSSSGLKSNQNISKVDLRNISLTFRCFLPHLDPPSISIMVFSSLSPLSSLLLVLLQSTSVIITEL